MKTLLLACAVLAAVLSTPVSAEERRIEEFAQVVLLDDNSFHDKGQECNVVRGDTVSDLGRTKTGKILVRYQSRSAPKSPYWNQCLEGSLYLVEESIFNRYRPVGVSEQTMTQWWLDNN